jgi:hypothetical protein
MKETTFHGNSCRKCKETLRYKCDGRCVACQIRRSTTAYHQDPVATRKQMLLRLYGISDEDYQSLLESQHNKCAICATAAPDLNKEHRKYFSVDHDHNTGKIRGLLCNQCNLGIGCLNDDPELLRKATSYLTEVK